MADRISYIFEDDNVIVIDKPAGISVHTGHGREDEQTVADLVRDRVPADGTDRSGIVHRLDRDTSGVMIIAKTPESRDFLQQQFKARKVEKTYTALVHGRPKHLTAILDWPIARHPKNPLKRTVRGGGKDTVTKYSTLKSFDDFTLLEVRPKTGRTHQIRVHLSHLGHPIVGDSIYGKADPKLKRQFLHASNLRIKLPDGDTMSFSSPLPPDLAEYLESIQV